MCRLYTREWLKYDLSRFVLFVHIEPLEMSTINSWKRRSMNLASGHTHLASFYSTLRSLSIPTEWFLNASWIKAKRLISVKMRPHYIGYRSEAKFRLFWYVSKAAAASLKLRETFVFMNNLCGYWKSSYNKQ